EPDGAVVAVHDPDALPALDLRGALGPAVRAVFYLRRPGDRGGERAGGDDGQGARPAGGGRRRPGGRRAARAEPVVLPRRPAPLPQREQLRKRRPSLKCPRSGPPALRGRPRLGVLPRSGSMTALATDWHRRLDADGVVTVPAVFTPGETAALAESL